MAAVIKHIGTDRVRATEKGVIGATRKYQISGIEAATPEAAIQAAYGITGLPGRGAPHPAYANIYAFDRPAETIAKNATGYIVEITCDYSLASTAEKQQAIEGEAATIFKWRKKGSLEWLNSPYDFEDNYLYTEWRASSEADPQYQGETISKPSGIIEYELTYQTDTDPENALAGILGKRNYSVFRGKAAGTVLCTDFDIVSVDNEATFDVTVQFSHRAATWFETLTFNDPATGKLPANFNETYNQNKTVKAACGAPLADFSFLEA